MRYQKEHTTYTYENMIFRMFLGLQRDSNAWVELYKIRAVVGKAIKSLKYYVHCRKKKLESPYYESRCVLSRHSQPV